jgi:regulator of sirC expression with transglutaminase-like and TPR domain
MTRWPRRQVLGLATLGLAGLGCRTRRPDPQGEPQRPLTQHLLELAAQNGFSGAEAGPELERLARQVAASRAAGRSPAAALNHTIFEERGFGREIEERGGRFMLLPPVLASRRGSCVGLGSLYLALAERLGWKAHGVLVPGHFFVRIEEGGADGGAGLRSVELLRQGETMPESWYRQKYAVPARGGTAYLRPLTSAEVAAVIHFNLGNEHREGERLPAARAQYQQAVTAFPDWAEAQASLGLTDHLLGRLAEARQAYRKAADLHPELPGLARNRALLEQEIAGEGPAGVTGQ